MSKKITIKLTSKQVALIDDLVRMADRGNDDFEYLVGLKGGDYSRADIKRHRKMWTKVTGDLIPALTSAVKVE